ncbi:MAG: S-layer homology domain-containing protein, partial [bacterium]
AAEIIKLYSDLKTVERFSTSGFLDVKEKDKFIKAVVAAKKKGFFKGYWEEKFVFGPEDKLRRADAALLIARDPLVRVRMDELKDWKSGFSIANTKISIDPAIYATFSTPGKAPADSRTPIIFSAAVGDPAGLENIESVVLDLRSIGGPEKAYMSDNGTLADTISGDGIYNLEYTVMRGSRKGEAEIGVKAINKNGKIAEGKIFLTVLSGE